MPGKEKQFYLGNKNLPTPDARFEWTSAMVAELKKCSKNILHFAENYFYIVNLDRGKEKIKLHTYQKRILRSLRDNRFVVFLSSRQSGKTTLMTIYALWIACFFEDQRILIVANKEQTAINIFKRVRLAYEQLPNYLKPGAVEYGKTSMVLGNGSSIGISTTSSDAGRGDSCNVLILDELAFIDDGMVQDFWKSVYPIISSSKRSKIFVASTPNGTGNLFHELYSGAIESSNGWKAERVDWWEVPGRDEEWKEKTIRSLGSREFFDQEFGNVFLQSGESSLSELQFEKMLADCKDPEFVFEGGKYKVWEEPNEKNLYVVGVDVAEGVNSNYSVVQILDITDLKNIKQVACYADNNIVPYNFISKLLEILKQWGSPPVLIERNNCGAQVVDQMKITHNYENIVTYSPKINGADYAKRPGVIAHTNTKYRGVTNMRYWINELNVVRISEKETVNELKNFVRYPNGTWAARQGSYNDDRVMSLIWALMVLDNDVVEKYFEVIEHDTNMKPLKLKLFDYGLRYFMKPSSYLTNEKFGVKDSAPPIIISRGDDDFNSSDIDDLQSQGWNFLK
jgi:hypothetical protein